MAIFNSKARHKRDKEDDPAPNPFEDDKEEVEQKPAFSDTEREGMRRLSTRDIAEQLGVEYVPKLDDYSPDPDALRFANADLCRKYTAIPVKFSNTDNTVTLAMADPRNVIAIDDFSHISGMRIAAIAAEADDINSLINRSWRVDQTIEELSDEIADVAAEQDQFGARLGGQVPVVTGGQDHPVGDRHVPLRGAGGPCWTSIHGIPCGRSSDSWRIPAEGRSPGSARGCIPPLPA